MPCYCDTYRLYSKQAKNLLIEGASERQSANHYDIQSADGLCEFPSFSSFALRQLVISPRWLMYLEKKKLHGIHAGFCQKSFRSDVMTVLWHTLVYVKCCSPTVCLVIRLWKMSSARSAVRPLNPRSEGLPLHLVCQQLELEEKFFITVIRCRINVDLIKYY